MAATDPDGNTLTYTLGGTDAATFDIDSTSGQLKTKDTLDYETKNTYSVTITVSDGSLTDTINVTINVTDIVETIPNRAPVFTEGETTTRAVAENTIADTNIGAAVAATDPDGNTLTYTLGGTDAATFDIDSTSGQLKTKDTLNYENKSAYSVTITASDGDLTDVINVNINVTNQNDAPIFTEGETATRTVAENTIADTNIGAAVAATDPDGNTLTYTLGGTDAATFDIDSTNGQLKTKDTLNYEDKSAYSVTITASDGDLTDVINVNINVTDVNENRAPVFTYGENTTRTVAENTAADTNIGTAVAATDADNDTLTYTLSGTDAASFAIVNTSGQLKTSEALDFETKSSYAVTVSVSDGKGGSDSIGVTISVTDVNENRAPVFTDGENTTRSVAENTTTDTNIGTAVAATDADNDTLTYTLSGTDAISFAIENTTGHLKTKATLNYETKSSYSVTVSVSDGKGGSDSIGVTISVTDVNENRAPVFTDGENTTRTVAENTAADTNIGIAVAATDADNDTLTYTLSGTDAISFAIENTTGHLKTKATLNYETKSSYSVTVSVSDDNGGTDSISVTITVTDITETTFTAVCDRTLVVRDAIVSAAGVDDCSQVTEEHLAAITSLNIERKGITTLQTGDFDGLTALTTLNLQGNSIIDISPLEDLTALTTLNLRSNSIIDISPLEDLTALTTLDLPINSIIDISPLEDLTALTTLNLTYNSIIDISPLAGLTSLTLLYLNANSIIDISPLEDLTSLTLLNLINNSISDISPLEDLTSLRVLTLINNSISDISPLEDLTSLKRLTLSRNSIIDISPLAGLTSLTLLYLASNSISDISPLEDLTALRTLHLTGNTISDYGPLRRLIAAIEASGKSISFDITIPEEDNNGAPSLSTVPMSTSLLANYPNPFNPETWIPYQLAKSADVSLTFYNIRGVVVRRLVLGHRAAGVYYSRSRAAHWDGRNSIGEKVATGTYFCTFTAGDFITTRKMVIRK